MLIDVCFCCYVSKTGQINPLYCSDRLGCAVSSSCLFLLLLREFLDICIMYYLITHQLHPMNAHIQGKLSWTS
jgi:hypothetical protein